MVSAHKSRIVQYVLAIAFLAIAVPSHSQMHRPILSDVFSLYNFLHRDYSGPEEPEVKQKRIEEDRAMVISILGSYVDNLEREKKKVPDTTYPNWDSIKDSLLRKDVTSPKNSYTGYLISENELKKIIGIEVKKGQHSNSTKLNRDLLISTYPTIQKRLAEIKKTLTKELENLPSNDSNIPKYLRMIGRIEHIDNDIRLDLSILKRDRDAITLDAILKKFDGETDYKNPLLQAITDSFSNKYSKLTAEGNFSGGKPDSEAEIPSSGQKAAFGLPGIAGSAPMMVDVINEVLMEEIKAELANAVFSLLQNQLVGKQFPIEDGKATRAFTVILEKEGDSVLHGNANHKYDPNNPGNNIIRISKGNKVEVYAGKKRCGKARAGIDNAFDILAILFPKTKSLLADVAKQEISQIVDLLKETIREDLKNLLPNLGNLDEVPVIKQLKEKYQEVAIAFEGIDLMNGFASMRHPVEIFSILPESEIVKRAEDKIDNKNLNSTLRLMEILAYSLTLEENGTRAWVSANALEPYLDKPDFYKLYFGCLLGLDNKYPSYQIKWFKDSGDDKEPRILRKIAEVVNERTKPEEFKHLRSVFYQFSLTGEYVNDQLLSIKQAKAKGDKPTYDRVVSISNSISSIVDTSLWVGSTILEEFNIGNGTEDVAAKFKAISKKVRFLTYSLRASTDIYKALGEKQYVLAIGKSMDLLLTVAKRVDPDSHLYTMLKEGDWQRTANFLVSIAIAEDRDDLEEAMKQFAHNPGSWRVKRESNWNVSLGVYGGAFGGWERFTTGTYKIQETVTTANTSGDTTTTQSVKEVSIPGQNRTKCATALSLSVGLNVGKGFPLFNSRSSFSLYVPVIDIGAVTAFRWQDSNAGDLPEFQWKDVIAPGAYFYWGLPSMPISIGFGGQYSPGLRSIQLEDWSNGSSTIHTKFANSYRWGFCAAVDLSLLNFHTSAAKKGRE